MNVPDPSNGASRLGWPHQPSVRDKQYQNPFDTITRLSAEINDLKTRENQLQHDLFEAHIEADCDPLTGLWNHRVFHRLLNERLTKAALDGRSLALIVLDIDNFRFFNDLYGHPTGDDVLLMVAGRLEAICGPSDTLARFGGDEFALLIHDPLPSSRDDIESELAAKLNGLVFHVHEQEIGIPIEISLGVAVCSGEASCLDLLHRAEERLLWAKTGGLVETAADQLRASLSDAIDGFSMLDALVTAVDNKDRYTRRHSQDVMSLCLTIAGKLGLDSTVEHTLAVSAMLHDVGKIGVPDSILRKPGKLTEAEYAAVKLHPTMGAAIVSAVPGLEATLDAIRYHHECYDGTGYPLALRGSEIPMMARIMAVADSYSAMTMDRPYRKGMDSSRVRLILEEGAGKQWDSTCVQALLAAQTNVIVEELSFPSPRPKPRPTGECGPSDLAESMAEVPLTA